MCVCVCVCVHIYIYKLGEGNGNPLQCSCLENPRDRGAWWAAVYGLAQSQTQLKRLSSSSIFTFCVFSTIASKMGMVIIQLRPNKVIVRIMWNNIFPFKRWRNWDLEKLKICPKSWGKYVPDPDQTHKRINSKAIISFSVIRVD